MSAGSARPVEISVLICTRNRASSLPATLASIEEAAKAATWPAIEVVVVDNGSRDTTPDVLRAWKDRSPLPIVLVQEARPGLSRARNAAVSASSGRILVFTDDDCVLGAGYFRELLAYTAQDTGPVIRGGRVELGDPADLPLTIKLKAQPESYVDSMHPGSFILGCNMTMTRNVVDRVGAFDELFGAGARFRAAEETDFLYRAHLLGIPIRYVPDLTVRHFHGRRQIADIKALNDGYAVGGGALYAKHTFTGGRLLKHLYWDMRKAARELVGGPVMNAELGLRYRSLVAANFRGYAGYWAAMAVRRIRGRAE